MSLYKEQEPLKIDTKILILGQVGSKAYGTSTPASDDDYMAVCLAPLACYTGLDKWHNDGTYEAKRTNHGFDMVAYELHKFVGLCLAFNPNVIPLLYLREQDYLEVHPAGRLLITNRDAFISQRAFETFFGYAKGQLSNVRKGITGKLGQKRKELIQQYGYDVKFAYHTIRLLRMINEFMADYSPSYSPPLIVYRHDAAELMDIREGKWSQERFFGEAEALIESAEGLKDRVKLPESPDRDKVNELVMWIVDRYKF